MTGASRHIRFLLFLNLMVFVTFTSSAATVHGNLSLDLPEDARKVGVNSAVTFPASQPVKQLKTALAGAAPDRSVDPSAVEDRMLIRSVLVPRLFSFAVVQQPENNPFYVSSSKNLVTEFSLPKAYNNIGLLAHNNLAGKTFKYLSLGQEVFVVHKDGHPDRYIISAIYQFQALEPENPEGQFVDLQTNETLTATELFTRMYTGEPHLTFQTCIEARGDPSWGRLFVIATPVAEAKQ